MSSFYIYSTDYRKQCKRNIFVKSNTTILYCIKIYVMLHIILTDLSMILVHSISSTLILFLSCIHIRIIFLLKRLYGIYLPYSLLHPYYSLYTHIPIICILIPIYFHLLYVLPK